jgi:hypothetical protein
MAELAHVKQNPSEENAEQGLTNTARKFRDVIEKFKQAVYDSLESYDGPNMQDTSRLKDAVNRIIQLGNILDVLLLPADQREEMNDQKTNATIRSTSDLFRENGIVFDDLNNEEREQCKNIIEYDIRWYPYSIKGNHTESLRKRQKV